MENQNNVPNNANADNGGSEKKSLNELLSENPELQSEFDKKLDSAHQKWLSSWEEKAKAEKEEAERLAKMTEEEKHKEELRKLNASKELAEKQLNAYKLKQETQKIFSEKGLDLSFAEMFDYSNENAESLKGKIDTLEKTFKGAVNKALEDKLKQTTPHQTSVGSVDSDKAYLDNKYKNNPYYKG